MRAESMRERDVREAWRLRKERRAWDRSHFSAHGDSVLIPQLELARVVSMPSVVCVCVSASGVK